MVDEQSIVRVSRAIAEEFRPQRIILFGSYAHGDPGPDSDVDLLVVLAFEGRNLHKSVEILNRVAPPSPSTSWRAAPATWSDATPRATR